MRNGTSKSVIERMGVKDRGALIIGVTLLVVAILFVVSYAVSNARSQTDSSNALNETDVMIKAAPGDTIELETEMNEPTNNSQQVTENQNDMNTELKVNGETVAVPDNGTVHKEITTEDGNVKIDMSMESDGGTETNTRSSIRINTNSSSSVRFE